MLFGTIKEAENFSDRQMKRQDRIQHEVVFFVLNERTGRVFTSLLVLVKNSM
jgi:hypothetical protein